MTEIERLTGFKTLVKAVYDQSPCHACSQLLVEAAGVAYGEPISYEKSVELGFDHSGLESVIRDTLTAMREPVDVEAAARALCEGGDDTFNHPDSIAGRAWCRDSARAAITAHIDAILGEG